MNSINSSYYESPKIANNKNNEINFKETYVFMIESHDYKFSFLEKNGQMGLNYYRCDSDDNSVKSKTTFIFLKELKDFYVVIEDGKNYHSRIILFRFYDPSRNNLEIISHVKQDYDKFVSKLEKYVKKANIYNNKK